jgi:hypothetical protein
MRSKNPIQLNRRNMNKTSLRKWALLPLLSLPMSSLCTLAANAQDPAAPAPAPAAAPAPAPAAAPATFKSLSVFPPAIKISAQTDSQRFMAMAVRSDGITVDVTDQVQWTLANPAFGKLDNFTVFPVADGATELIGTWNGMEAKATLEVTQSQTPRTVGFERDVMLAVKTDSV